MRHVRPVSRRYPQMAQQSALEIITQFFVDFVEMAFQFVFNKDGGAVG